MSAIAFNPQVATLPVYIPGKPIDEVAREHGLDPAGVIKLASNENPLPPSERVVFGATVSIEEQDDGSAVTYQIVGEDEADIRAGRISFSSPIARALIAKSVGDVVEVSTPGKTRSYEITAVRYL